MSDETGSTAFSYDAHGRLLSKAQTAKSGSTSRSHTLSFVYDSAGRLARQTYPSGAQADLAYGLDGRPVEIRVNGQVLISDIVYQPFGEPKAWTWGNGTPYARQYDQDGRLDQYPLGNDTRTLGFDAAGRIVTLSTPTPPSTAATNTTLEWAARRAETGAAGPPACADRNAGTHPEVGGRWLAGNPETRVPRWG